MNKKIWSAPIALVVVLVSALIFGGITVSADTTASGEFSSGVIWTLDSNGVFTVSGSGAMDTYQSEDEQPWADYRNSIKSVIVEPGVTSIGRFAFYECTYLTSLDYSSDVTTIEQYAFAKTGLTSVTIPNTVTNMGSYVFMNCQQLTSAVIEEGVTTIPDYTFSGCTSLSSVSIPSSVKSVGNYALSYTALTSVTLPVSWTSMGDSIFYHCSSLTSVTIESGVTTIPNSAFSNCTSLTSIDIPASVTTIGVSAFSSSGLTELTIPSTVTTIENGAFSFTDIKTVTIPSTVTSLGTAVFLDCKKLESATIVDGIIAVPDYTFFDCSSLVSVTIPSSVTSLGDNAFMNCTKLESLDIPSSVTTLGGYVFYNTGFKSFDITSNYKSIGYSAFENCSKLTTITFSDRNDTVFIGASAFANTAITSIAIPAFITGEDYYGYPFVGLNDNMFYGCNNLETVELLEGVEYIGNYAFKSCKSLVTVIIPSTIKYIDYDVFKDCTNVTDVYCYAAPGFTWEEDGDDFIFYPKWSTKFHVLGDTYDFASAYSGANVTFVGGTNFDARVVGHSVTLSADIGLNFFIRLPEGYNSDNTEVTFSWGIGDKATTAKGKLVSVNQHGANYKVTCYVFSYSMVDEITMVVKSGNTELITDKYSVEKYINILGQGHTNDSDQSLNNLLAAMVLYGQSAQTYFNYRKDYPFFALNQVNYNCFNTLYNYRSDLNTVLPDPNNMTIKSIDLDELGIKFYAASVLCGSQNKIRFYFEVKDADKFSSLTASYNSQNLTFKSKTVNGQQLVYIETPGLAAGAIESAITVTIGGNDYTYDFRYYIQQCVANNAELKFADVACYLYAVSHYARIYQQGGSSNA